MVPAVWLSSRRTVTGLPSVNGLSGNRHERSAEFTSASRSMSPASTSASTASAATALLMDAAWNNVVGSMAP